MASIRKYGAAFLPSWRIDFDGMLFKTLLYPLMTYLIQMSQDTTASPWCWSINKLPSGLQTTGRPEGRCSRDSRRVPGTSIPVGVCHTGGRGFKQHKLLRKAVQFTRFFVFLFFFKKRKKICVSSFRELRLFCIFASSDFMGKQKYGKKKQPEMHRGEWCYCNCVNCSIFSFHCCCWLIN